MTAVENRAKANTEHELDHVIESSFQRWSKWMAITAATAVTANYAGTKFWPAYARVGTPRRFFGWALFCLGVSQYNLEEQELEMMRDHNTQFREQAFRETEAATQAKFLADLEKRKQAEAAAAAAKH